MLYDYFCSGCSGTFEVSKVVDDFDRIENCPTSGTMMTRLFKPKIHLYGTKVEDKHFHTGLGQVVNSTQHARQLAKERGLIEVGNERVEKYVKWTPKDYE